MSQPNTGGIVVHHLNASRSYRIIWLLEELEVPYELKEYKRTSEQTAPEELKKIHPLGKAPVITDGDVTLAESGAIVDYIITKYGGDKLKPTDAGWVDNLYFTHYAEGSLMPYLVMKIIFQLIPKRTPFFIRPFANLILGGVTSAFLDPTLKQHAEFIEAHLAKSQTGWFANGPEPTSADFQMYFAAEALVTRNASPMPKIKEFLSKVHERPAYKRALEKVGELGVL